MCLAVENNLIDILEYLKRILLHIFLLDNLVEKAGRIAGMARCSHLGYLREDCVIIAVCRQRLHILDVAGGHAFRPEFLTAPAEIGHLTDIDCGIKSFLVHVGKH